MLSQRLVKSWCVKLIAKGPVFVQTHYEIEFADGGFYRANVQVAVRLSLAKVSEEYDGAQFSEQDYWELDLTKGWQADATETMRATGNGAYKSDHTRLADFAKKVIGADSASGTRVAPRSAGERLTRFIVPDSAWGGDTISYLGLYNDAAQKGSAENYPLVGVIPLHKGDWRRPNVWEVWSDGREVRVLLPMAVRPMTWLREITSETSPFSMHEHDPKLPATFGRRVWGLQLAQVPLQIASVHGDAPFYRARAGYGIVGLDRYKDFTLEWPDKKEAYPRVFIQPDELEKYRKTWQTSPAAIGLKNFYSLTGDAAVAQKNLALLQKELSRVTNYMLSTPSMGHHHTYTWIAALADDVLSWPQLPPADRTDLRARLALLSYLYMEPDVNSAGTLASFSS
jgi:hypothetical protein